MSGIAHGVPAGCRYPTLPRCAPPCPAALELYQWAMRGGALHAWLPIPCRQGPHCGSLCRPGAQMRLRVQIGAPALHPLPWLFPLSSAPSPRVAYMLLQSMMGHACRETINHEQSNAAGCWWPPVQGRVLAGWGCRLHYPPPTLPLGRIGSASP